jgi:riboflavin synthase
MFTGLIQERGLILADPRPSGQGGVRLVVGLSAGLAARLSIGASLAISGVCLTVVRQGSLAELDAAAAVSGGIDSGPGMAGLAVEMAPETVARTTLGSLRAGAAVNLEPALLAGDPLGGHLVQGHVDGTTEVAARQDLGEHRRLAFAVPPDLAPYLVEKGSITVDGVSLTVAGAVGATFEVTLIPHTLAVTTLGALRPGDRVNLEVDVLAKYVQRMLAARGLVEAPPAPSGGTAGPQP